MGATNKEPVGKAFRYTTIGCDVFIFAFVGWFVGREIFGDGGEILGALVGSLIGILIMFLTLLYLAEIFGKKSSRRRGVRY